MTFLFARNVHYALHYTSVAAPPVQLLYIVLRCGKDFIKFVNLLMNDTTFLLDESLSSLKSIHDLQDEIAGAEFHKLDAQRQESRRRALATDEKQCRCVVG